MIRSYRAPAPLNRVPSRALTLSSPRPQEHAIDGDTPLLAALGATMNPDGTLSGPGSKAGGPHPRHQLEMVRGWRAFRKIFGNPHKVEYGPDGQPLEWGGTAS